MDSLRASLGYPIRADISAACRAMASLRVPWLQGRQVQPPLPASACSNADLSAPARELHQRNRVLNHCKVCAGKSGRNQICLCCHSHFSSACSEGMGLKGCSGSWKGGEETNVNKNRLCCQSVSDVFGYPVLKVSKHIKVLPWEKSQRRLSSPEYQDVLWMQTFLSAFLQAEWKGAFLSTWVVFPSPGCFCMSPVYASVCVLWDFNFKSFLWICSSHLQHIFIAVERQGPSVSGITSSACCL